MDNKFDNQEGGERPAAAPEKSRQTTLLLVLLLLLGGFGYLYFFTGLIRPQEPPPAPPQPVQKMVKQPLPARDAAPNAVPVDAEKPKAVPQSPNEAPAPAVTAVKPAAKPLENKSVAIPPTKPVTPVPSGVPAKPPVAVVAPAAKKSVQAKAAVVPVASGKPMPKTVKPEPKKEPVEPVKQPQKLKGPWTLVVGSYVVEEALAADITKVKKAGFNPLVTSGPKHLVTMNRLFYAESSSKEDAQRATEKLRAAGGDGFSVQRGSKYEVFAGSYSLLEGAKTEQQRLASAGVKVDIRKAKVAVASRKLTAGTFTDRKAADESLKKLKGSGVGTPVLE